MKNSILEAAEDSDSVGGILETAIVICDMPSIRFGTNWLENESV